jgi:hypothetical protein
LIGDSGEKPRRTELGSPGHIKALEERFGGIVKLVKSKSKKIK